jgi:large subunit ribosomal protein L1
VHTTAGMVSFDDSKLIDNIKAIYSSLQKLKPTSAKGIYIKNISISSTMGPGIRLDENQFR